MPKKRYIFPYIKKGTPFYSYAVTAKTMLERLDEVYASFERFANTSSSQSPQHLLYMMLQHNESLLQLSEFAMNPDNDPDSASPRVKSRKESSTSERRSLKRKRLSLDESEKSKSLDPGSSSSQQKVSDSPPKTKSKSLDTEAFQQTVSDSPPKTKSKSLDSGSSQKTVTDGPPKTKSRSLGKGSSSSQQTVSDSLPKTFSSTVSNIGSTLRSLADFVQPSERQIPRISGVKRKCSSDYEYLKSGSFDSRPSFHKMVSDSSSKKDSSTFSKPTDLVSTSKVQPPESTSTEPLDFTATVSEILKDFFKKTESTTDVQENVNPTGSIKMAKKTESKSPALESQEPALPFEDEKDTSTYESSDLVLTSTSTETSNLTITVRELSSPIKKPKENISPGVKEYDSTSGKAEMPKTDAKSPFKIPEIPLKYKKELSKPAESISSPTRQFLSPSKKPTTKEIHKSPNKSPPAKRQTSMSPRREFVNPNKKGETSASPRKVGLGSIVQDTIDAIYSSPIKEETDMLSTSPSDTLSKECSSVVLSKTKIESSSQTPPMKDDEIEIDMPSPSGEKPGPSHCLTESEMEMLFDDPSRVESIKEAVEERIKVRISLKKIKEDTSPPDKKSPRRSPRKPKKIGSPGKDIKPTALPDLRKVPQSILSHPFVISYLKMRFKSILANRKRYLKEIHNYFNLFYSDVHFLCSYSISIFTLAQDIPVQGEEYFNRDVANLRRRLMRDARGLTNHLRPFADAAKVDRPFWVRNINQIKRLNKENSHLLSTQTSTQSAVELLREYESQLRVIWNRMDRKVLETDGMRLSMVEICEDFKRLIKDFGKYLQMIKFMKPFSLASAEEYRTCLRESYY